MCAGLLPATLCAQTAEPAQKENEFSTSVQIRSRAEYRNGALNPRSEGESPAGFVNERARVAMDYKRPDLQVHLSAQHVGVWGQDPQIDKNGRFALNEAWAQYAFGDGFFARLGRQALAYDDERLLGALDWNVAGRSHDALKLGYEKGVNKLHLILAFNQNDERTIGGAYYATGAQPYKNMQTAWYHYTGSDNLFQASLLFMNLGWETGDAEKARTRYMQTMGTYLTYKPGDWTVNGTLYFQTGKNKAARNVSAWMAAVAAAFKLNPAWTFKAGADYLSGDDGTSATSHAFDPLYGTHHKFYGAMDYFYASAWKQGAPGLVDATVGASWQVSAPVGLSFNYHYFSTAKSMTREGAPDRIRRGLGSEFDAQLTWKIKKDVQLTAGYSIMRGTRSMDFYKGGDHTCWQDWGWVSLNINPRVFFAKWK
ncbi:MAG: alginate export family protein [Mediterranea sp.]|nr:alginate export family protein [Mediterranea sp.]